MRRLIIEGTKKTPAIDFNQENLELKISGRSLLEDTKTFYQPIFDWIEGIYKQREIGWTLIVNLEYFNTASSKMILNLLILLGDIHSDGAHFIKVIWNYDPDDEDMQEAGLEYSDLVDIPFQIVPLKR
ncbi:MAG: DUF1987 domain-containing protein [Crocinitomix sp.]|nr:DUF1987 domain-containing protein [Crocinitomix sp.]